MPRRTSHSQTIEPAHSLMYGPNQLPIVRGQVEAYNLLIQISRYMEHEFNTRQKEAFCESINKRISLIWGPPGTGKTAVLSGIILGWIENAWENDESVIIGIGANNYNAIDNVLSGVIDLLAQRRIRLGADPGSIRVTRVRSSAAQPPKDSRIEDVIRGSEDARSLVNEIQSSSENALVIGGTWTQLGRMAESLTGDSPNAKWFDLLVIDEASQLPVSHAAAYFLLLKENGHVVLAGDHRQLGPIYSFKMNNSTQGLFDCIFSYMQETHGITPVAFECNYRMNTEISGWPRDRFYTEGYEAYFPSRKLEITLPKPTGKPPCYWPSQLPWSDHFLRILDPDMPVVVISYGTHTSTLSNPFEAQMVASLSLLYKRTLDESYKTLTDKHFWSECLGIVTPHRAQMSTIRNLLISAAGMPLDPSPFVDTVDRFQGLEREMIIASYVVADRDFVAAEEEFILEPRRFNVSLTRSRRKFIMFISDAILQHLPFDEDVARKAAHLQLFAEQYCDSVNEHIDLPYLDVEQANYMECFFRGRKNPQ
ncbi:hypothetical protein ASZ90_012301 [hydrocarbon metagenome]|uniref:DNA2/NAM7 helicase-like C-terminal domain-containing protein n=1 Tax=hydrocarbon metagenome TaxID=938273 RepID=A0A0W8FC90_9ZZZZ|nr:AAA domain-containing protein [Methanosaeta sp. UBA458]